MIDEGEIVMDDPVEEMARLFDESGSKMRLNRYSTIARAADSVSYCRDADCTDEYEYNSACFVCSSCHRKG